LESAFTLKESIEAAHTLGSDSTVNEQSPIIPNRQVGADSMFVVFSPPFPCMRLLSGYRGAGFTHKQAQGVPDH
jgi:hypothetical protein